MATYHCKLNKGKGSYCLSHANYILREGRYSKEASGREDLVYKESGNLPAWANSPQEFWKAAGTYERVNGVAYFELEIALPNELSDEENKKIVQEYVKQVIGNKPYTFAIHNKPASLNEDIKQPHAHIMFSERVAEKNVDYTKEQFFKRYNPRHPERGGAKKDTRFTAMCGKENIKIVRQNLEKIINESYENNGLNIRVSSATLQKLYNEAVAKNDTDLANYYNRAPEKHLGPEEVQKIKSETKNLKTKEEKKEYFINFASDAALDMFYARQCKEAAAELMQLNKEREELHKKIEELEKIQEQINKTKELAEKPVVKFVASDAVEILNNYIKKLTDEERNAHKQSVDISKFVLSEKRMLMYAQAVYTHGATKKLIKEFNNIKRIEKKYNDAYTAWENTKPTGFNPVARYKYAEEQTRLEKWKADIDYKKAANQAKIDYMNKELHKPEAKTKIQKMVNTLRKKNDIRAERASNFRDYSKQLNNQIALCYTIRNKLRQNQYDKENKVSIPNNIYQSIKTGDITHAQNVINELRSAVNKLETNRAHGGNNSHFLSRSYDEEKDRGGFER